MMMMPIVPIMMMRLIGEVAIKSVINGGYLGGLAGARPTRPNGFITANTVLPDAESNQEPEFKCDHCDIGFKTRNGLKIHAGKTHKKFRVSRDS